MSELLLNRFLRAFKDEILPLTFEGVNSGNKIFGAAIINKNDHSLVVAGTNNETKNPLWHGEIHTLKKFYEVDKKKRPDEKNCIFLSSHEPCSLCLSAIAFSGFDNFYYLPQEGFIFNDTLRENITLGNENISNNTLKDAVETAFCEYFEEVISNTICSVTSMLMLDDRRRLSTDPSILPDNTTNTSHVAVLKHASVVAFVSVINAINQAHYDLLNETTPIAVSDEAVALVSSLDALELQTSIANNLMDSNHEAMANEVAITDYVVDDGVQHAPETVDDDNGGSKWDWLTETHTLIGVAVGAAIGWRKPKEKQQK